MSDRGPLLVEVTPGQLMHRAVAIPLPTGVALHVPTLNVQQAYDLLASWLAEEPIEATVAVTLEPQPLPITRDEPNIARRGRRKR